MRNHTYHRPHLSYLLSITNMQTYRLNITALQFAIGCNAVAQQFTTAHYVDQAHHIVVINKLNSPVVTVCLVFELCMSKMMQTAPRIPQPKEIHTVNTNINLPIMHLKQQYFIQSTHAEMRVSIPNVASENDVQDISRETLRY